MKISFVGLGQMGKGMALNLAKSGCDFIGHDIRDCMFGEFTERGLHTTLDVSEVWDSDIIFMCLQDTKTVEEVVFREGGLADKMKPGQILVDCSTIAIPNTIQMSEKLEAKGIHFLDAPVTGRQVRADDGTLTIMCGGKREIFEKVKPYLEYMGKYIHLMGPVGSGQMAKMINNCIYDINIAAFCELMCVGTKIGLDPEELGKVINSGSASSSASQFLLPMILEGDFVYSALGTKVTYKDVESCVNMATQHRLPTPMLDALNSVFKTTLQLGYGKLYKGAFILAYEDLLGIKCRKEGFENADEAQKRL